MQDYYASEQIMKMMMLTTKKRTKKTKTTTKATTKTTMTKKTIPKTATMPILKTKTAVVVWIYCRVSVEGLGQL